MTSLKALKTWAVFFSPQRKTNVTLAAGVGHQGAGNPERGVPHLGPVFG